MIIIPFQCLLGNLKYLKKEGMNKRPMILVIVTIIFFVFSGTIILQRCKPKDKEISSLQTGNNEFIGDSHAKVVMQAIQ